jgi:murein endopeptidase
VVRWSKLDKKNPKIYAGRELAIYTKHIPPPQRKLVYEVASGDTWAKIAGAHHVDVELLRERWNPKVPRKFKAGQDIVIWIDPLEDPSFFVSAGSSTSAAANAALPLVAIPRGSISVGEPHDGRLVNSIQLPENKKLYTLRRPEEAYGSSHTLDQLQLAIARWRRDSGYTGSLKIGSISKQGGGKLKPHSSHRSGRDVDIRLPLEHKDGSADNVDDVDWDALWSLIMAFVDTGEVETIYLTTDRQKHLHAAAKRAKASADTIDRVLQYPDKGGRNNGIVRHQHGHEAHIHVRFTCAANETQCE